MSRFTRKGGRKTRKMRKPHTRKRSKIQFGGSAEKERVDGLLTTIIQKLKSKKYDKLVYEKDIYELFDSIVILLSQTDQVSQDMHKQILFINSNNISDDEDVNKLLVFMSQLLSRRLETGYVKKQLPKDTIANVESIFAKYKNLCDCVEQIKPCNVEELANSINEIYEPRATIKKNIEKLLTSVKDNYDDIQIYITVSGFVKFHRTLDEWRKMIIKNADTKVTRIVELLKPIVDKYSFLVPRASLDIQFFETDFNILFAGNTSNSKKTKSKVSVKEELKESAKEELKESEKEELKESEKEELKESVKEELKESAKEELKELKESAKEELKELKELVKEELTQQSLISEPTQLEYVKGVPSAKRQQKLAARQQEEMKKRATDEFMQELEPIKEKIQRYSNDIKRRLEYHQYTDDTFDILMAIDVEQLYSSMQRDFDAFVQFVDKEDGKFKYMFYYEPTIDALIKPEYKKAQCMLLFTIGRINDILIENGIEYAKYILKGGGAMKLMITQFLKHDQSLPPNIFLSNDIDVKTYLDTTKFEKISTPTLMNYQYCLGLIFSKIFRELIIYDRVKSIINPETSILKMAISFLEPLTGGQTSVFKISLDLRNGRYIPIADIDPNTSDVRSTQKLISDKFESHELKFYVDKFNKFVDDKLNYFQIYNNEYLQNPNEYNFKMFNKFFKYINLFIYLIKIRPTFFNKTQITFLKQVEMAQQPNQGGGP